MRRFYSEIMDNVKSAIYANTLAIIRENEMLSEEKFIRLSDAEFSDAVKMLRDYGYGSPTETTDAGSFVTSGINSLIAFVEDECPSPWLKKFILNQFSYGNAKLLYKSRFVSVDKDAFYEMKGLEELKRANQDRNYEDLPPKMRDAFVLLDERSEGRELTSKEIDIVFTRAMNEDNLKCSEKCGLKIKKFYRTKIDLINIITTLRCKRLKVSEENCREMLLTGGYKDEKYFIELFNLTEERFEETLQKSGYENIVTANDIADLTGAEQRADDYLLGLTKRQLVEYTSREPFLRYFLLQMREFGLIKYLLISLKNGARETLKGRLKELYGTDG